MNRDNVQRKFNKTRRDAIYHVLTKSYFPPIAPGKVSQIMMRFVTEFSDFLQYTSSSQKRAFSSVIKQEKCVDVLAVNYYKPQMNRYVHLQFCVTDATFDSFHK